MNLLADDRLPMPTASFAISNFDSRKCQYCKPLTDYWCQTTHAIVTSDQARESPKVSDEQLIVTWAKNPVIFNFL